MMRYFPKCTDPFHIYLNNPVIHKSEKKVMCQSQEIYMVSRNDLNEENKAKERERENEAKTNFKCSCNYIEATIASVSIKENK